MMDKKNIHCGKIVIHGVRLSLWACIFLGGYILGCRKADSDPIIIDVVEPPAALISARAVRIVISPHGELTITANNDEKSVAKLYYSLMDMANLRTNEQHAERGENENIHGVCVFLANYSRQPSCSGAFAFTENGTVINGVAGGDPKICFQIPDDALLERLFSHFKKENKIDYQELREVWPQVVERLRLGEKWESIDEDAPPRNAIRKKSVFPYEVGFYALGISFEGKKQDPGNIVGWGPPEGSKELEFDVPLEYNDEVYLFFGPAKPEEFDDDRLKTWADVLKEADFPQIGFRFERCDKITADGFSVLQGLDHFSCVAIDGRNASPQVLALENLPEIKILYFLAAEKTTLDDFRRLARLKKSLKSLSLELRDWPQEDEMDELLDVICKLENVRKLSIRSKPLPLESVRKLKSMSSLKLLTIVTPTMQDGSPCPLDILQAEFPGVEAWQTDYKDLPAIEE